MYFPSTIVSAKFDSSNKPRKKLRKTTMKYTSYLHTYVMDDDIVKQTEQCKNDKYLRNMLCNINYTIINNEDKDLIYINQNNI